MLVLLFVAPGRIAEGQASIWNHGMLASDYAAGNHARESLRLGRERNEHDDKATKEASHGRLQIEWWAVQ